MYFLDFDILSVGNLSINDGTQICLNICVYKWFKESAARFPLKEKTC